MSYLNQLLQKGIKLDVSDIHLTVDNEPMGRVNGKLKRLTDEKLTKQHLETFIKQMLSSKKEEELNHKGEVDLIYHINNHRFRVNVFYQRGNLAAALRLIPNRILSLEELGLPEILTELIFKPRGLFLVTGPTGSGKSTTLAAMIDLINSQQDKHIITLEDPIEYIHQHKRSIVNQREVGEDTKNFANGLRSALRQDPDVILVGEMRDLETISTAITAAETGHLVFATLHTNNAAATIERIINVFPPHKQAQVRTQLSLTLQVVLSQQLLPTITGLSRVVATELLVMNSAISNLIREGKTHQIQSVLETGKKSGMHTMDYSLRDLFLAGDISKEVALEKAGDKKTLERLI